MNKDSIVLSTLLDLRTNNKKKNLNLNFGWNFFSVSIFVSIIKSGLFEITFSKRNQSNKFSLAKNRMAKYENYCQYVFSSDSTKNLVEWFPIHISIQ